MRWFRFYSETLHKPKVRRLPSSMFRNWVLLLCIASEGKPRGVLPCTKDIGYHLGCSETLAQNIVDDLIGRGLLDEVDGNLKPHNWDERQPQSDNVTERVKRFRQREGNAGETLPKRECNVLEKNREEQNRTETEEDAEAENNIFRLYEQTIGPFDAHMASLLEEAEKEYAAEHIKYAFQEASENNARSWRYVETILKHIKERGHYAGRDEDEDFEQVHKRIHHQHELAGKRCPICYVPEEETA